MLRVYGDIQSGNCYKIKLLASHLSIAHEWIHIDILKQETHTPEFLARNPNGKIPVIVLDDGRVLTESNAILAYLAHGTAYLPTDRWLFAKVLEWQFFEQYSHEPYIATARFIAKYLGLPAERRAEYEGKQAGGYRALGIMEGRLSRHDYLVGEAMTVADISLYAYTHVADQGGFSLERFPGVQRWCARIARHPRHVTMDAGA
jgi:glutathione S-transferase